MRIGPRQLLPEAAHHQQRIIDRQTKPEHRRDIRAQEGERRDRIDQTERAACERDSKDSGHDRNDAGRQRAEGD